jgi:hypothetical protein
MPREYWVDTKKLLQQILDLYHLLSCNVAESIHFFWLNSVILPCQFAWRGIVFIKKKPVFDEAYCALLGKDMKGFDLFSDECTDRQKKWSCVSHSIIFSAVFYNLHITECETIAK